MFGPSALVPGKGMDGYGESPIMRIVLLGTSGYHPTDARQTACMMLPECGVILDAGTAMYRVRDYIATATLDIFLTHTHLDHVIGLTYLFNILHGTSIEHVRVHGQGNKLAALREHLFSESLFPVIPPLQWQPLPGGPLEVVGSVCPTRLTSFPLTHPGGSLGYRLDCPDRSLAYITDTTASEDADYVDHIRGVDLLLHECYFPDGWEDQAQLTGHSCLSSVAKVAQAAGVGRLVLIHINPLATSDDQVGVEKARKIFSNTQIGTDRMELEF